MTIEALLERIATALETIATTYTGGAAAVPAGDNAEAEDDAEAKKKALAAAKRRKAAAEKKRKEKEAAEAAAAEEDEGEDELDLELDEEEDEELTYDDIKPVLSELAAKYDGKKGLIALLQRMGARSGKMLKPNQLVKARDLAQKAIDEGLEVLTGGSE